MHCCILPSGPCPPWEWPHARLIAWLVPFSRELGQGSKFRAKIQPGSCLSSSVCPGAGLPRSRAAICDLLLRRGAFMQFAQSHCMCQHRLSPPAPVLTQYLGMPMLANIHLGKGAGISDTNDLHGEIAEEVYDLQGSWAQAEDEDEGCNNGAQQLLQDEHLKGGGPRSRESGRDPALTTELSASF